MPHGRSDEPFDLGVIRPNVKQTLKVGDVAPAFEVKTVDGKPRVSRRVCLSAAWNSADRRRIENSVEAAAKI